MSNLILDRTMYFDVVVVGSGLSALYAVVEIGKKTRGKFRCALVSSDTHTIFNPLIYDYIEGEIPLSFVSIPIFKICKLSNFAFLNFRCIGFDNLKNNIQISNGQLINYKCLVLAAGRAKLTEITDSGAVNLSRLSTNDLQTLRSFAIEKKTISIIGSGNSGLEYHMKSSNASLITGNPLRFSQNVIPSLMNRFLESISNDMTTPSRNEGNFELHAYPECVKSLYDSTKSYDCAINSLHHVNDCLQTSFSSVFCMGDQAVMSGVPSSLRNSAQLSYQQRKVIAYNVLSFLNNSCPRARVKPFNWGSMYTYGVCQSEVSILQIFVLKGRLGHLFRYLVYWLRLPHKSVRFDVLKDFIFEFYRSVKCCGLRR